MSSEKLKDYGSVSIVEATTAIDPNVSWVEAHVIKEGGMELGEQHDSLASSAFYRDIPFAVAFIIQFAMMGMLGLCFGSYKGLVNYFPSQDDVTINGAVSSSVLMIVLSSMVTSVFIPFVVTAGCIPKYPKATVTASLLSSTITNICLAILLSISFPGKWYVIIISILWSCWSIWYYFAIQPFIPYAAAILKIATEGISRHWGMYTVSFASSMFSFVWLGCWIYVANGLLDHDTDGDITSTTSTSTNGGGGGYDYYYDGGASISSKTTAKVFVLLLSLYWTLTVLMNITQTTVAGVIATYCFENPSNMTPCSSHKSVSQSLTRALTTSFGSICFGSLLSALITTLRIISNYAREHSRQEHQNTMALLFCLLQCILSLMEDIIEYFNQWSYIFVGIYGTSYLESGKMVLELFRERGCEAILTNGLNMYVLNAIVGITGLICGVVGATIASASKGGLNGWVGFGVAFFIGVIFSSIMASTLQGAVKGVLICYVDHPGKMHEIHPNDTKVLVDAIALVFPNVREFRFAADTFMV